MKYQVIDKKDQGYEGRYVVVITCCSEHVNFFHKALEEKQCSGKKEERVMTYYLRSQTPWKWALSGLLMVNFLSFSHFLHLSTKRFSQKMDGRCMTPLGSTRDR